MAAIATDGKGNYLTLNASGDWVPTSAPEMKPAQDEYSGTPSTIDYQPDQGVTDALGRIGQAAVEGYRSTPASVAPTVRAATDTTRLGRNLYNPLVTAFDTARAGLNAVGAGAGQAIYEAGEPLGRALPEINIPSLTQTSSGQITYPGGITIDRPARTFGGVVAGGPGLGRDLNIAAQVVPVAQAESSAIRASLQPPIATSVNRLSPMFAGEREGEIAPGTSLDRIRQAMQEADRAEPGAGPTAAERAASRDQPPPPPPPPGGPETGQPQGAQPAGAQITPGSELGLTPKEEAAYRSTAEGNKLLEPQEPGVRDDKQYLPGERINEAEASQDVQTARELKSLRQQTPELDAQMMTDETHNNNARANAITNAIPGYVQITAAKKARTEALQAAEPKVFGNATSADVQPIVQDIQDILNDPKNRQNSQLQQYVRPLTDRLQNADGTPKIVDPRELWSWRQDIQHLTSGAAQATDRNLTRISGILGRVLDKTDDQLEAAAPGYKAQLRDDYRTRSREIDAMEALNAERFKLFDSQNKPNYNAVQGLMRRIVDARQANDPYDAYTHVTQETLDKLWNIRDSMRRSVAADRLAAPRGSPTSQNLGDALRAAGRMAVQNAAPAAGAGLGAVLFPGMPVVGSTAGLLAGTAVNHLLSARAMAQRMTRGTELLNPNRLGPQP